MSKSSGLTTGFVSLILLPIAGNAVEHITAVMVAMRNKMDLALGIAIGSSIQIALFVLPSCVVYSWSIGNPFTLDFNGLGAHGRGHRCSVLVQLPDLTRVRRRHLRRACGDPRQLHHRRWQEPLAHGRAAHLHLRADWRCMPVHLINLLGLPTRG